MVRTSGTQVLGRVADPGMGKSGKASPGITRLHVSLHKLEQTPGWIFVTASIRLVIVLNKKVLDFKESSAMKARSARDDR